MIKTFEVIDKLVLDANESSTFTLLLKGENIDIEYHLSDGEYNILVFNDTNNLKLKESGYIKNGSLKITYLELNNYTFKQENKLEVYKDSVLTIDSVYLGVDTKDIVFDILNAESLSEVNISNNVVCLNDADFTLSIIGNIKKGSKYCKCHQKSRCLTFENPKKAKILPILNIDECDVEASHSLSSGTIDEDVLFYMNSRGLTFSEALLLLIHSYLMPDDEFYKQFENGDLIKEKASKKVETIC